MSDSPAVESINLSHQVRRNTKLTRDGIPIDCRAMNLRSPLVGVSILAFASTLLGDEVEDSINEALKLYKEGKYSEASTSLQVAVNGINEKKGGTISSALPEKIGEWKGDEINNSNALSVLGGGTTVERKYSKGDRDATITIIADSPMIGQVIGLMSNPTIAGLAGMKMKKAGANTVSIQKDQGMGQIVVDNRFLIQIQGSELKEADVLELAGAVKTDVLKEIK